LRDRLGDGWEQLKKESASMLALQTLATGNIVLFKHNDIFGFFRIDRLNAGDR
jgi:hypothetical protein